MSLILLPTKSIFLAGCVKGIILRHFYYYLVIFTTALLHGSKLWVVGGGPYGFRFLAQSP